MGISSLAETSAQDDQLPLLMDPMERHSNQEHVIDITRNDDASSSSSVDRPPPRVNSPWSEDIPSSSTQAPINQVSSSANHVTSRNSSFTRRGDQYGRRSRSPLNSRLWISVELVVTVGQIIASVVVLSLSRNENPQAPLFVWVVGYASGCVATLPILYWRFHQCNQGAEQGTNHQASSQRNPREPTSYTAITVTQNSDEETYSAIDRETNTHVSRAVSMRLNGLIDHLKMALDCFFAVWFVVGNVWIFGGHSSPSDAPKLYRLCIVFLTFSCIGYAMPFILCATICCCLPCIISLLGFREDFSQTRGATMESINALPTYKFKSEKTENVSDPDSASEGGVLAAGTPKERVISGEDAVCCICLAKYADNDELRELPCIHVFHVDCVDKWLKINATCPLCKSEVGETGGDSPLARDMN